MESRVWFESYFIHSCKNKCVYYVLYWVLPIHYLSWGHSDKQHRHNLCPHRAKVLLTLGNKAYLYRWSLSDRMFVWLNEIILKECSVVLGYSRHSNVNLSSIVNIWQTLLVWKEIVEKVLKFLCHEFKEFLKIYNFVNYKTCYYRSESVNVDEEEIYGHKVFKSPDSLVKLVFRRFL